MLLLGFSCPCELLDMAAMWLRRTASWKENSLCIQTSTEGQYSNFIDTSVTVE